MSSILSFQHQLAYQVVIDNIKKKGKRSFPSCTTWHQHSYGCVLFHPSSLFRDWDFYRDIVQTAKAEESQRGLSFLRKEYQKNVPKEIKPQIINSKSTNQTSEESKDVRNLLRGLIWLRARCVASHAFL